MEKLIAVHMPPMLTETDSTGARLSDARDKRGWSQAEVARMLCLQVKTIAALEDNNFKAIGPDIFVRGYLQNYARLLQLPLTDFSLPHTATPKATAARPVSVWQPCLAVLGIAVDFLRTVANYGVVILLALLVFIWWHQRYHAEQTALSPAALLNLSIRQSPFPPLPAAAPPYRITQPALAEESLPDDEMLIIPALPLAQGESI